MSFWIVPDSCARCAALFLTRHNERGKDRDDRTIHGHGDGNILERNAVKQDFHVLDTVNRHARLAHIACYPGMITVITAMGRQIEGNRNTLLSRSKVLAVKPVTVLGRRKSGILSDRPGPTRIHRCLGPAHKGRKARQVVEMLHAVKIITRVKRLDGNALIGLPDQFVRRSALAFFRGEIEPVFGGFLGHHSNSRITSSTARLSPALALIFETLPFFSARRMFSIFIASTVASAWPS